MSSRLIRKLVTWNYPEWCNALILCYFTELGSFRGAPLRKVVEDVSVKKFTFAILSPNEFLVDYRNSLLDTACPTSCSGVFRPYMQHAWSLAPRGVTTFPWSCSNYTGYQYVTANGI